MKKLYSPQPNFNEHNLNAVTLFKPIAKRPSLPTPLYILSYIATLKLKDIEKEKNLNLITIKKVF